LQQDHYISIANALMMVTGITGMSAKCRLHRFLCPL